MDEIMEELRRLVKRIPNHAEIKDAVGGRAMEEGHSFFEAEHVVQPVLELADDCGRIVESALWQLFEDRPDRASQRIEVLKRKLLAIEEEMKCTK